MSDWFWNMRYEQARERVINARAAAHALLVETMVLMTRVPQTERYVRRSLDARLAADRAHLRNLEELERLL